MLILIIVLGLVFGLGGGYFGYSRWGTGGGAGIVSPALQRGESVPTMTASESRRDGAHAPRPSNAFTRRK